LPSTVLPESVSHGDDKLYILSHKLSEIDISRGEPGVSNCVKLVIKNASDKTIATAIFNVVFYDKEGNEVDNFEHKETYIKSGNSRSIIISLRESSHNIIKSYNIKVVRTITSDIERVQVFGHSIRTNQAGEEEIIGIVKNLSDIKTDAILVATFSDINNRIIGIKAIIIRDINPDSIKKFYFKFLPQKGDKIKTYNLKVVCDIEEC
jgi:hypothetical protein